MIPFLIAGAVGFGIAKLLEEDTKKYADGGEAENNWNGEYLTITANKNRMVIKLTNEGIQEVNEMREDEKSDAEIMYELFEDINANSELIYHSDLGDSGFGLTSASGVTDGYNYNDNGDLEESDETARLYYFNDYALRSEIDDLLNGELFLNGADNKFADGGKLKVGKDDFSFLLKLSDKELSKRLDLIRKQQVINGKQYLDAKKKGGNTTKIEESGKRLSNQENAIIQARMRVNKMAKGGEAGSFSYDYYEVYDESTGKSLMIYAIDQEDAESIAEELDFESFEDGDEYNPNEDEYADVGVIEVVGKGNKGTFRNFEGENMTEKEVIQWGKERGYTEKEVIQWLKEKTFAEGGKLKVGKDDFSFLLKLSDKELSKRLDLIRKQQVINGKQYLDAKKKGGNTTKIEESGKRLSNQENAIIQARMRVNKMAKGGEAGKKYILLGYSATASKDSYEEGELEDVGDWDENFSKEFSNKKDLINYINKNILYVDYDESHFDWETGEGKNIQTDVLCTYDDYNGYYPADEKAKQLWKKGKKELFNVHYWINVQAVIPTAYKRGGEIEFKRGKGRGVVKEVYFKGAIRPSFYVSYDNDENDIKKGLKSWCKTHNYNYDDIIKVKYAGGGQADVNHLQASNLDKKSAESLAETLRNYNNQVRIEKGQDGLYKVYTSSAGGDKNDEYAGGGETGEKYNIVNGTAYNKKTPKGVIDALELARTNNIKIKIYYGDVKTGRDWVEEYDTIGTIGRSTGTYKVPLLIKTSRSYGGGAILDSSIVKIVDFKTKEVLYKNSKYKKPNIEIVESDLDEYAYNTLVNGEIHGRHKSLKSAQMTKSKIMSEGGETGVHSFQAGDKVIFNQDPSGRIGDNIYYGTILEINNGVAKIDHQNSNMKNVIRNVNIANLKKYAGGGELAKPISFTEEKKGWYFVEFSDGINVFVDFTLPEFADQRTKKYIFQQAIHNYKRELEEETPYQVYNQETSNVEGYFDNEIEAEEFASQFKNASVYDLRKYAEGGSVSKGYNVFNYTDDIYATDEVFKTKKLANDFIKEFRSRFSKQGYYRDNQMNKIDVKDIDLLAIPSDFNPFGKAI